MASKAGPLVPGTTTILREVIFKRGSFYAPDPDEFLAKFRQNESTTVTGFRISKDHLHFAHTKLVSSTSKIHVIKAGQFPINTAPAKDEEDLHEQEEAILDDSVDVKKNRKKRGKEFSMDETAIASSLSLAVEESPSADAYLLEKVPVVRSNDKSLRRIMFGIWVKNKILHGCLATSWRTKRGEREETTNDPPEYSELEPIFTSNGKFLEKLFHLRRPECGTMCESLTPFVKKLPLGIPTISCGILRAQIAEDITAYLEKRERNMEMEKHLMSAVILETVAFTKYLADLEKGVTTAPGK